MAKDDKGQERVKGTAGRENLQDNFRLVVLPGFIGKSGDGAQVPCHINRVCFGAGQFRIEARGIGRYR